MSEIFFTDNSEVPLPPDEVKIISLDAKPRPDGQRIAVIFEVTPFQVNPNIELRIEDESGNEHVRLSVVEAIDRKMDFTMHLRGTDTSGKYILYARLFYADIDKYGAEEGEKAQSGQILKKASQNIDTRTLEIIIP
jgi:hypothetical protein